jgi:hypothetical protein
MMLLTEPILFTGPPHSIFVIVSLLVCLVWSIFSNVHRGREFPPEFSLGFFCKPKDVRLQVQSFTIGGGQRLERFTLKEDFTPDIRYKPFVDRPATAPKPCVLLVSCPKQGRGGGFMVEHDTICDASISATRPGGGSCRSAWRARWAAGRQPRAERHPPLTCRC